MDELSDFTMWREIIFSSVIALFCVVFDPYIHVLYPNTVVPNWGALQQLIKQSVMILIAIYFDRQVIGLSNFLKKISQNSLI